MHACMFLVYFQMLVVGAASVRVRDAGEGSAVINDGASTSAGQKGESNDFRRPETTPVCLHAIHCVQCRAEQRRQNDKIEDMCSELRIMRMRHEDLVARCIERNLLSPEYPASTKGASGSH
jgi:hypothetical protein